jgi:tRNA nucleotidyltransferase (CCA-adding enzyme)
MPIPAPLRTVLQDLARSARPLLVGGCVRDWLMGLDPKDFDIEVYGCDWDRLEANLRAHGSVQMVGRSFGVMKLKLGQAVYDFSLPRRESKNGRGHRGFQVKADPNLSERDAAARRDFTINSLMYDPLTNELIDHFGGHDDLERRILRHTGVAFSEDPLRVLRGFQLAARFSCTMAPETTQLCRSMLDEFQTLPVERVWAEWEKWCTQATRPSEGLRILKETGWIGLFPQIAAIDGVPQDPEWHPEGDVLTHTGHCLDALTASSSWAQTSPEDRKILSLAVLAHDFGKATTTLKGKRHGELRWISPRHDTEGGPLADDFLAGIGAPPAIIKTVRPLVEQHLYHLSWKDDGPSPASIRRLARRLEPATIEQLCRVMEADSQGRPPLDPADTNQRIHVLRRAAREMLLEQQAPRPLLLGRHLIEIGLRPGRNFSPILKEAFEAQLDGAFDDLEGARQWLDEKMKST